MNRTEKEQAVAALHQTFQEKQLVVVTHYIGLSVAEVTDLRRRMLDAGASFKVTKNRLARIALKGTEYEVLDDLFTGPTAIAVSDDPVAAARVAVKFAKENDKLKVIGGAMGSQVLDETGVKALADLPSLDELRARLAGLLTQPATKVASTIQAPAGQLARVFNAYAEKGDAA